MDAIGTETALLVALSAGALWATLLAADHPDRVDGVAYDPAQLADRTRSKPTMPRGPRPGSPRCSERPRTHAFCDLTDAT